MSGIVDKIKSDVKKAGTNLAKFAYIREGEKKRYRFLNDADDGMEITFHDSFSEGIKPTPCQEVFGRNCPYCDRDGIRTRSQYAWSVWDYDEKEVKVFMFPVNNCSPVPQLINFYETYGTLLDRDYVISVSGKQKDKAYAIAPMDKVKFRNDRAKPFSVNQILKLLDKAYPCNDAEEDDEDNFPMPKPGSRPKRKKDEYDEDKLPEYEVLLGMSAQKLYNLCKERDLDVKPRKTAEYYANRLDEWRTDNEENDDYDDGEGWGDKEEEEPDYNSMSAQELYKLCKEREIDVQPRKSQKYYIEQLQEYDKAQDDWGDGSDSDEEWEEE